MGRPKKITTEELKEAVTQYALKYPGKKIKIPEFGNFIRENGKKVEDYLIRRDKDVVALIDEMNSNNEEIIIDSISTYHQLDVKALLRAHSNRADLEKALMQRDSYYSKVALNAGKLAEENKELKRSIDYYKKQNDDLKQQIADLKEDNKARLEKEQNIMRRKLKAILSEYVYPDVANTILSKEGLLETIPQFVDQEKTDGLMINSSSDIQKAATDFDSINDLLKGFDEE